ncbi:2 [Commensalibacter communis]|uniref:3-methylmercaptopropionyl-CoA ligase n=1 Tax=Commensalibacter communis TaxID=2972786 RepID=A0A9W4TQQ8_9PROT|nr:AMP-binding protein [Commensalibacter communis]CAI3955559.1 2 [Commensalibacter communis] [Commensalibacter communis]CAI3957734.1 2 [Commensalibacter communis] [Commensalibacter communis]CAI3958120.1 2 [Commensalibacter communis] [Commensalibacter communis]CAI3959311.1 2 [Commensalibacter communis] [Commensalibacter communis]
MNSCDPLNEISNIPYWPQEFVDRYIADGLWTKDTFGDELYKISSIMGDKVAVTDNDKKLSFEALNKSVNELALGFLNLGLQKKDIVIVQLPNSIEFIEITFALFRIGVIPIFALPAHRENELNSFCSFTKARAYITADMIAGYDHCILASSLQEKFSFLKYVIIVGKEDKEININSLRNNSISLPLPQIDAQDIACFQLSGGTTGIPKLIVRRHQDYLYNVRACIAACHFNKDTTYLAVLPMGHNFPMACPGFIGTILAGGHVVITRSAVASECFDLIEQEEVTVTALVPPLAMVWLNAASIFKPDIPSLQVLQVGGARLSNEAARQVEPTLGCKLQQVFGMAEGLICFTDLNDSEEIVTTTQGKPMSVADEVRVVDELGHPVPDGEVGYILTRGPYTIRGYFGQNEANKTSFTEDGFYKSGDLVRKIAGYLIVEGRDKDQIIQGGENISIEEIEGILIKHSAIIDAVIVGLPDEYYGERICAFVLCKTPPTTENDLRLFLKNQGLAPFKIPYRFEFLDQFPTTGVGKISKKELRKELLKMHLEQEKIKKVI